MVVSEHVLSLEQSLLRALFTAAESALLLGPNCEVALMRESVQDVREASLSSCLRNAVQP